MFSNGLFLTDISRLSDFRGSTKGHFRYKSFSKVTKNWISWFASGTISKESFVSSPTVLEGSRESSLELVLDPTANKS
jgi:hypothetical protein